MNTDYTLDSDCTTERGYVSVGFTDRRLNHYRVTLPWNLVAYPDKRDAIIRHAIARHSIGRVVGRKDRRR